MHQELSEIEISTSGSGFTDITYLINQWIYNNNIFEGILVITCMHTSCSLIINENADPRVLEDLSSYMSALVPEEGFHGFEKDKSKFKYKHADEGLDDMPAHIRTALTCSSLSLSISSKKLLLGTWQAVYLWEHRYRGHLRKISLHAIGELEIET